MTQPVLPPAPAPNQVWRADDEMRGGKFHPRFVRVVVADAFWAKIQRCDAGGAAIRTPGDRLPPLRRVKVARFHGGKGGYRFHGAAVFA